MSEFLLFRVDKVGFHCSFLLSTYHFKTFSAADPFTKTTYFSVVVLLFLFFLFYSNLFATSLHLYKSVFLSFFFYVLGAQIYHTHLDTYVYTYTCVLFLNSKPPTLTQQPNRTVHSVFSRPLEVCLPLIPCRHIHRLI